MKQNTTESQRQNAAKIVKKKVFKISLTYLSRTHKSLNVIALDIKANAKCKQMNAGPFPKSWMKENVVDLLQMKSFVYIKLESEQHLNMSCR